jgi:hypothetical protein
MYSDSNPTKPNVKVMRQRLQGHAIHTRKLELTEAWEKIMETWPVEYQPSKVTFSKAPTVDGTTEFEDCSSIEEITKFEDCSITEEIEGVPVDENIDPRLL